MKPLLTTVIALLCLTACEFNYNNVDPETRKKAQKVDELVDSKNYDSALVLINELIKEDKDNAGFYHVRATIYVSLEDHKKAEIDAEKAIELDKNNAQFFVTLSKVKTELTKYDEAVVAADRAITLDSKLSMAYVNRAVALLNGGGSINEAVNNIRSALVFDPKNHVALANLGYIHMTYEGGSMDSAGYYLRKSLDIEPGYVNGRVNLAAYLAKTGDFSEALKMATTSLSENPNNMLLYRILTFVQIKLEDYQAAVEIGEEGLKKTPVADEQLVINTGTAYYLMKEYTLACQTWGLSDFEPGEELAGQMKTAGCER